MKKLVLYNSWTGNTKKVAEAIYEELKEDVDIIKTEDFDIKNLNKYDYVFIGFFVDKGYPDELTMRLLPNIKNIKIALFATLGAYPYSMQAFKVFDRANSLLPPKTKVEGCFICQGRVSEESLERINKLPPDDPKRSKKSTLRREIGLTHPDDLDLKNAREFARNIIERDI